MSESPVTPREVYRDLILWGLAGLALGAVIVAASIFIPV